MNKESIIYKIVRFKNGYTNIKGDVKGETYLGVSRNEFPDEVDIWNKIDTLKYSFKEGVIPTYTKFNDFDLNNSIISFYDKTYYTPNKIEEFEDTRLSALYLYVICELGLNIADYLMRETFGVSATRVKDEINENPESVNMYYNAVQLYYMRKVEKNHTQEVFLKTWLSELPTHAKGDGLGFGGHRLT
ncbi:MAG: hypothetical protein M0R03_08880 [Novosphingobium sp.]|nr:hypothetical protein [Novosphingobium sp.]